jgi:hypothetical protein
MTSAPQRRLSHSIEWLLKAITRCEPTDPRWACYRQLRCSIARRSASPRRSVGTSFRRATWSPVTKVHFPGCPDVLDEKAPEDIRGYAPPFLSTVLNGLVPGILQIWTGYMVRTRPDWILLVRPPANLPRSQGYEPYEGIMETDRWFYPLFSNLRITATDRPIFFDSNKPLLQVQPLRRETDLRTAALKQGLDDFREADWTDYRTTTPMTTSSSVVVTGAVPLPRRR